MRRIFEALRKHLLLLSFSPQGKLGLTISYTRFSTDCDPTDFEPELQEHIPQKHILEV